MKKLSIIFTAVALMLNVMSAGMAHACQQDSGTQIIQAVDDASSNSDIQNNHCTQCSCHHNCSTVFSLKTSSSQLFSASKEVYNWKNTENYSQVSFPPSKPPRA